MSNKECFSTHRYVIQTVDPVHIGTGGMRLGRVDNSIVREPGTKLPKIPGTSLSGAIRHYAAYRYGKKDCAKQGKHCGSSTCPICYTFGSVEYSGIASTGDARILFFPVYSMAGPVWVTGVSALTDFIGIEENVSEDKARMSSELFNLKHDHLNLGWLMVEKDECELNIIFSDKYNIPDIVKKRIVLVSDKFFSQIVNSNLEVRTSVSINPETGAAEDGALFTYEAIPRATFLWFDVIVDDYRGNFPSYKKLEEWKTNLLTATSKDEAVNEFLKKAGLLDKTGISDEQFNKARAKMLHYIENEFLYKEKSPVSRSDEIISAGLEWAEHLGIGGMGTRGFGRIRNCKPEVKKDASNS